MQTKASSAEMADSKPGLLERVALSISGWAERWYPDAFIFAAMAVAVVALGCLAIGASPVSIALSFGDGFWSIIPFTLQVSVGIVVGFVVAHSAPAEWLIQKLALAPKTGRGAVAYVALLSMLISLLSWTISLIFGALLVRAIAARQELKMDYRAASAAAYMGIGATWALGISSAAAQFQANASFLPKALIPITGSSRSTKRFSFGRTHLWHSCSSWFPQSLRTLRRPVHRERRLPRILALTCRRSASRALGRRKSSLVNGSNSALH